MIKPDLVGTISKAHPDRTDISLRMESREIPLAAGGQQTDAFKLYLGPKRPELLQPLNAGGTITFGWFSFVSVGMVYALNFFHNVLRLPYGLAIVLGFIGVKLILEALAGNNLSYINNGEPIHWAPHVPIWFSLLFIGVTLAVTTVISLRSTRDDDDAHSSGSDQKPAVLGPGRKDSASKRSASKRHPTKKR